MERSTHEATLDISVSRGSFPVTTGSGEKLMYAKAYEAWEDTVIASFKDADGNALTTGWEDVTIPYGKVIFFNEPVSSFTVTSGGLGQYFKA